MLEGGLLALQRRDLLVEGDDQGTRGREIRDLGHGRLSHTRTLPEIDPAYNGRGAHATRSYQRRRRVCARSTPPSSSARSVLRISTGPLDGSRGQANVPRSRRRYKTQNPP